MKLSFVLVILTLTQVKAKVFGQSASIHLKNVPITQIFHELKKQTNYDFLYTLETVQGAKLVTLDVDNEPIDHILNSCFDGQPFTYSIENTTILVLRKPSPRTYHNDNKITVVQELDVRGIVRDQEGQPLPGVSIKVKGTANGVATDNGGRFVIKALPGAVLSFSMVGYLSKEVPVGTQTTLQITLEEDAQALGEVVVTALGISREKKSLSYAVTEVGGESFTQARENNLGNALSGKIAGVNATSSATGPSGSSRVVIRGNGSLSGDNQPLYVVNGIPINNANQGTPGTFGGKDMGDGLISINPDDIQSISVLKGGTAAALYGSRAANGVILITTKSGQSQEGIGIELNSTYTMEDPLAFPDWQYRYGSGSRGQKPSTQGEAIANGRTSWGAPLDGSEVIQFDGVLRPYVAQKNNIQNFYNTGNTFSNTLALTGGNENANFRFSVANMDNHGIVPNSSLNRKTFNLSANANLKQKVVFEGRAQYSIEENKNRTAIGDFTSNPNASVGVMATSLDVRTLSPGYDNAGNEVPWNDYNFVTNPYFAVNKVKNNDDRRRFIGSFSVRYNLTDYLYARGRLGIDYINRDTYDLTPSGILYNAKGDMTTGSNSLYETNAEAILGLDKSFGKFSVNAIVGGNKMYNQNQGKDLSSGDFIVPFNYFIANGSNQTFTNTFEEWAINSLFGSADIGFNNYLYLNLTGRQDWFSTLSPKSNSLFYPSVGASFVLSEAWNAKPDWLSFGKIRASWAQVGGGAPSPYGLNLAYTSSPIMHLGQPLMTISSTTIPRDLKPYTSTTAEGGIEFRLFDNRIGADITFYNRTTTNDIVRATVPPGTGYENVFLNVGKMRNRGVELLLTGSPVRSSAGLNWDVSLNMAYNDNKVIKISDDLTSLAGSQPRTQNAYVYHYEGQPYGMIAGFRKLRDENGNIVYNNANGLPIQSALMPLGKGVPPLTLGLQNTFNYKSFSLGVLLDGKFGAVMYSSTNAYGAYYGLHKKTAEEGVRENGLQVSGVDQNGNPFSTTVSAQNYYQGTALSITEDYVSGADFVKLRQLTFGYRLPARLLQRTPFQSASLSLVARNLLLIYNQAENVDPESNYSISGDAQGLENFGVPPTRSFGLNLMVRF